MSITRFGGMIDMTLQQARSFLAAGTRTGKLAVVRKDGSPLVTPVWFVLDGEDVVFMTYHTSAKGRALRRTGRAAMVVDEEQPPYAFVLVEGEVSISEDPDDLLHWATVIGGRYMGADRAEEYGRRNGVPGELLVRLRPGRIVAKGGVAD
jgi:PPOX class probable F420-dependent enzyme